MSEFLVEAARSSAAIAASLTKLRQRAEAAIRDAAIADTVLDTRDVPLGTPVSRGEDGLRTFSATARGRRRSCAS